MPNPLLIFALMQAASMASNSRAQSRVNDARRVADGKAKEVRERNYATAEEARQRSLKSIEDTPQQQAQAAETRTAAYKGAQEPISTRADLVSPEDRGSSQVVAEEGRRKGEARQFTDQIAGARGQMDSIGDVLLGQQIQRQRDNRDINTAGNATANWVQNVLPVQLEAANRAGDVQRTIGDLFQMGAQIAGMKALGGAKATPGTPAAASAPAATAATFTPARYSRLMIPPELNPMITPDGPYGMGGLGVRVRGMN
jgi:hypothetical protein